MAITLNDLKVLVVLAESKRPMGMIEIARAAGVPSGSVPHTLWKLTSEGYVAHEKRGPYWITEKGIQFLESVKEMLGCKRGG